MAFGRFRPSRGGAALLAVMVLEWGMFCTATLSRCQSSPCQNGATCLDHMDSYRCVCPHDPIRYMGKDCEMLYDACLVTNCPGCVSKPGTERYTCSCPPGFGGEDCLLEIKGCASNPCVGARSECVGHVAGYVCRCPGGYGGEDCRTRLAGCAEEPCRNNGTCADAPGGYTCACRPGFRGEHCEVDVDECRPNPCRNGAICKDATDGYQCFCVPGFQGNHCEMDINECASAPCENNGTCVNAKDRYVCLCLPGFRGVNCEVEIDECEPEPCQNGGTCLDNVGLYACHCLPGYEGLDCEVDVDECASGPCYNEGDCFDLVNRYECDCIDTGFTGMNCEEDILECASNPCQNNGTCVEGTKAYSCHCWPGYQGDHCDLDIDECAVKPCENGGKCLELSDMAIYTDAAEFSYATAAGYRCDCPPGFTGELCSVNVDECESRPCQNGGICEDQANAYHCVCQPGFAGVDCEADIDECESQPCQNGAQCEDHVDGYTCHCPEPEPGMVPWGDRHCDVPMVGCLDHSCENGATCRPWLKQGAHGRTCNCLPGFRGENCTIPTTFSFSTSGFLFLEAPQDKREDEEVDREPRWPRVHLRFRTTLPNAFLIYGSGAGSSLSLEVLDGDLHAKVVFDNVVVRAKLPGPVNDGEWQEVNVSVQETLSLSLRGSRTCRQHVCVEESRGPDGWPSRTLAPFKQFSVGGFMPELLAKVDGKTFHGCMEDLLVDSHPVLPQYISPSQTQNMELGCHKIDLCKPNPCSNHGRCVDLWTSSRCDCQAPFFGDNCEMEYPSWTFGHENTTSYASYDIAQSHGVPFQLSFFLRSLKPGGLILQMSRQGVAYLTIYLQRRMLSLSTIHTTLIKVTKPVATGEWERLALAFQGDSVAVLGPDLHPEQSLPLGAGVTIEAGDVAHVGGLPLGEDSGPWGGHFKGCLQDMRLNNVQLDMEQLNGEHISADFRYLPNITEQVQKGCASDNTCHQPAAMEVGPCQNDGKCTVTWNDYACDCPANFTGRTCETRVWCASDPCTMGSRCVNLPDGYECLTRATFEDHGLQYRANGSLVVSVTNISVELRTREENGVLLRSSNGLDHFCLGLRNSSLLVKIRSGNSLETLAFTGEHPVSDGSWHRVHVSMAEPHQDASRWAITMDGQAMGISSGVAGRLDFFNDSVLYLAENFTGCLGEVRVGGVYLPFTGGWETPPQQARFLRQGDEEEKVPVGCTGSPVCLPQPCLNGGSCEDLFNLFSCVCAPGWEGQNCQDNVNDCASAPCLHGSCIDLLANYRCECFPGYGGKSCQEDLDDCQGHRCENGGSCVDGVDRYTCTCPPNATGTLCQWTFPPLRCELDVECLNGGVCSDGIWGSNCTCSPGFTGERCQVEVDECQPNPCQHGGLCQDRLNGFHCECASGFVGSKCESSKLEQKERIPLLVVAIPLACCGVLLAGIGLFFMVLTARKKRQSEGTYSPSQQEVAGARLEMDSVLKVPPEERLI